MMMDNELERDEIHDLVEHLRDDEQLKSCWQAYHLIGDTLRNNLPPFVFPDLTSRISAAIQNEPSYCLPQQAAPSETAPRRRSA
ncbi:MAG: sigma-E factor negative regulatory protein, partial [Gammaproteobacteria bacterium]